MRDLKAHERAKFQHVLHLLRSRGDERDPSDILAVLQVSQTSHEFTLLGVFQTYVTKRRQLSVI